MSTIKGCKIIVVIIVMLFSVNIYGEEDKLTNVEIEKLYADSYKYEALGKYQEAILALNELKKKHPNSYTVNYRIGWLYYLNKNYANSIQFLKKAQQIVPTSFEIMNMFCLIYSIREDWEQLELEAARIIKTDHYNLNANYWFTVALKMEKKYTVAERTCTKMLAIYPVNVSFLALQGEVYYLGGKYEIAYSIFSNLKIIDSNNLTAKYYLNLMDNAAKK